MVTLWQLLVLICFAAPIGPALASASLSGSGPGGYVIAVGAGVLVGLCCAWAMWVTHGIVRRTLQRRGDYNVVIVEWQHRAFYLAKVVWIVVAAILGFWSSALALRFVP